jgi:ABC-type multidrug transport system fused ATPase/permease subunit
VARTGVDWVLALWSTDALRAPLGTYVGAFMGVSGAAILLTLGNSAAWALGGLRAARALHAAMLATVLRCPVQYFDATPTGRLLNVFSTDVAVLDKDLPAQLASATGLAFRIGATLVVQAIILPWTLLGSVPLGVVYVLFSDVYRRNLRELKRLDLTSKGLAAACLSESVGAQATVAAWGAGARFSRALQAATDVNLRAYWASNSANRWLGLRLDWLGSALLLVVAAAAVGAPAGAADPGLVGLAITYAGAVTGLLNWLVRTAADAEAQLGAVERAREVAALPVEAPPASPPGRGPPAGWPSRGALRVEGLHARWRPELPPCLKGVTLDVPAGAKLGVVGRTGAGKTSLLMALFRVMEAERGRVLVDGVDVAALGLDELRQALSIVPQDATLFSGTVREALDPLGAHDDEALRSALDGARLGALALGDAVGERGGNLSAGERQLLCLARALLRRAKVVVLDESTSNLDAETDAAIQASLRGGALRGATLVVVAHRLATVMDADIVAVMDDGVVAEVGAPAELAKAPGSLFAALLRAAAVEGAGV